MSSRSIAAYARNERLYVVPIDGAVEVGPVFVADIDLDEFATAVERAIGAIPSKPTIWTNLRDHKDIVQLASGVKRVGEFERGLKRVSLVMTPSSYKIERWIPYPRERHGFAKALQVRRPADTPLRAIAAQVMKWLVDPDWPTR